MLPRHFEQSSRLRFDVFEAVETQSGIDHDALLIAEDVGGQARHAVFRGHIAAVNVIEYTFAPADTNSDGDADLNDFAAFQRCFGQAPPTGSCLALDFDGNNIIDLTDHAAFVTAQTEGR